MLSVKNTLRLPALFLLFCIVLLVLLTGLALLESWSEHHGLPRPARQALLASRVSPTLREKFPAAVLFALVLTLFPMYRRPGSRFLSYLLPMAAAFAVLVLGGTVLREFLPAQRIPAPGSEAFFVPQRFQAFGDSVLYAQGVEDRRLSQVVRFAPESGAPRLSYLPAMALQVGEQEAVLKGGGESLRAPARPAYAVLFAEGQGPEHRLLAGLSADLEYLQRDLEARFRSGQSRYLLTCLALVFSFFTAGVFFRVSRWPLANVLIAFLVMRGCLLLFRWLREGIAGELAKLLSRPGLLDNAPEIALLLLGVLLLLVDLLFFPFDRWQKEAAGA